MNIQLKEHADLLGLVQLLNKLTQHCNWTITETEIKVNVLEDSRSCYLQATIAKSECISYECDKPRIIGLSLKPLITGLKSVTKEITLSTGEPPNLNDLILSSSNQSYSLKLFNIETEPLEISPDLVEQADVVLALSAPDAKWIVQWVSNAAASGEFGNKVRITTYGRGHDQLLLSVNTLEYDAKLLLGPDSEPRLTHLAVKKPLKQTTWNIKFFRYLASIAALCPQLMFFFSSHKPLIVKGEIPNLGHVIFCIAPVITDDDEDEDEDEEENKETDDEDADMAMKQ